MHDKHTPTAADAFSPSNPAIVALRMLQRNVAYRESVAETLGCNPTIDEDSFFAIALQFEPPKGKA
jgi:hypothetical protein